MTLNTDHSANIKGFYGIDSTNTALTINPEVIYGYAHGIFIGGGDTTNTSRNINNI